MYLKHFGLRELPFQLTPDPAFFFKGESHHEALNVLLVALRSGEGFVKIVGEVGTGKTLLCRKMLDALESKAVTAYIPNPLLTPSHLYRTLAEELGVKVPTRAASYSVLKALQQALLAYAENNRKVVLLIDEAQVMPDQTLEALRLVSNLETEKAKLVQIVLFGQPELDEKLGQPHLRQLRQRIGFSYQLPPLDRGAVAGYVTCRLKAAGSRDRELFSRRALAMIFRSSQGIPRLVNLLCHKSMMVAYGRGASEVTPSFVRIAARDTQGVRLGWLDRIWSFGPPLLVMASGLFGQSMDVL